MHINIGTINGATDAHIQPIKDRIKAIATDPYNAADRDLFPGITAVAQEFRHAMHDGERLVKIFDLDKYRTPYLRGEGLGDLIANPTRHDIFASMDWFQWFALAHVPDGLWHLVDLDQYFTPDAWLSAYDRALRIAFPNYIANRDAMYDRDRYRRMNEMLNTDAKYIIDQTKSHDGCDAGKMQFLSGIQFIDRDLWEDDFATEYDVEVNVTYRTTLTITVPGGHDANEYINDYVGEYEFDMSYESPDSTDVIDYSES